jgi:hypothetical protein
MLLRRSPTLLALLIAASLVAGCSVELPPGAKGPVWEGAVKGEAQQALSGRLIGGGLIVLGVVFLAAGLLPDAQVLATVGLGWVRLGVLQVPVGLALVVLGVIVIYVTRYTIRVRDGKTRRRGD